MTRSLPFPQALRFWVKLGLISFGGPAGQIAIMHRELVERRRWIGEERFLHALNYCMLLPGPEAQQLATYIGWLLHRTKGGIAAGVLFVLPSIFILLALSYVYAAYGQTAGVSAVLAGFKPVVVAIVVEALLKIGARALKRRVHYGLAVLAFVSIYALHIPFPLIVVAAGVLGWLGGRFWPGSFLPPQNGGAGLPRAGSTQAEASSLPYVLDDSEPPPPHARPSRRRLLRIIAVGLVLWLVPFVLLVVWRGWTGLQTQEYRFFTLAALVTFGGAYAVLAYVTNVAVGTFGWLSATQAVDGLALAETTPGPLIMVLQFVGFIAGWNNPADLSPVTSAVTGALVTTYATFLPCFFFIFLGAPYIEMLRGNRHLSAALSGITAAVVGVVLNLALVFGTAVLWPAGWLSAPDPFAVVLAAVAFVALYRWKTDVLWVVLAGGSVGLLRSFL